MERNASDRGTRLVDRVRTLIRDWSWPLVVMLAWAVALTYTLVAVTRLPWQAAAPSQKPTSVVQARSPTARASRPLRGPEKP